MATLYKALIRPKGLINENKDYLFMAGSMNINWRDELWEELENIRDLVIFDPTMEDDKDLRKRTEWEQEYLDRSNIVVFNFTLDSKSPISLLELGQSIKTEKSIFLCCPDGFWKKREVEEICRIYDVNIFDNFEVMTLAIKVFLNAAEV